jgi:hypothetical protein
MDATYIAIFQNYHGFITTLHLNLVPLSLTPLPSLESQRHLKNIKRCAIDFREDRILGTDRPGDEADIGVRTGYLALAKNIASTFFNHLESVEEMIIVPPRSGPLGSGVKLCLTAKHIPLLSMRSLTHIFLSEDLCSFLTARRNTM